GIPFHEMNPAGKYKDANEALVKDRATFIRAVDHAQSVNDIEKMAREELEKESAAYALKDFMENIAESKTAPFYPTGFEGLDSVLDGGLYAGLYVVGAISSLGKTTFCLQVSDHIAKKGHDVLIFSLEMARDELIAKSVSRETLIEDLRKYGSTKHAKTTRGILTGSRYDNYGATEQTLIRDAILNYRKYAKHIFITEGVGDVSVDVIREKIQNHIKVTGKAPVVLIDYLQIIAPIDVRMTDKQNTDKAVLELKRMSRDYKVPIIGISSFNRDNYTAPVNLSSFKESGSIEYSSDVLLGLQYDGMDYEAGESEATRAKRIRKLMQDMMKRGKEGKSQSIQIKVLKNRNGSKGDAYVDFFPMFNYFRDPEALEEEGDKADEWTVSKGKYKR
ncbi:MAG: hypothetical protein IJN89_02115, partial [Anaerotignum sp.]|nr:hypothetical protein [Anaerotignum sp.]